MPPLGRPLFTSADGTRHFWANNHDGTYTVTAVQDCEAILDRNKAMATHNDGYSPSRELRRVASIPNVVALMWLREEGWWYLDPNAKDRLRRKLNDPDWRWLRTAPGVV